MRLWLDSPRHDAATAGGSAAPERVVPIFLDVVETVAAEMRSDVQTNEAGRAAPRSSGRIP